MRELHIDLDRLTPTDLADVCAIAAQGGVDAATCDLADPPVPVLAALIFVSRRRAGRRITPEQATRWAIDATRTAVGA